MARYTDEQMKEVYKIAARFTAALGCLPYIGLPELPPDELAGNEKFQYYCDRHFREIPPPPPPFAYGS